MKTIIINMKNIKNIKIGIDARTLMDKKYSGVSEYVFNLIKAITNINKKKPYSINNNYKIKLFYNSAFKIKHSIPKFESDIKYVYTRYPNKFFNYILQKILNYPKIDKLLDVDVFLMPHFNFLAISKAKKIITVHDLSFLKYPSFFTKRKNFWHKMLNIKKILRTSDKIVAISANTKKDIVNLIGINKDRIKVIYSGIDRNFKVLEKNNPTLKKIKQKYNLPDKFILYLGTLEPRKNIESIILAFEEFIKKQKNKNILLVIAGEKGWKNNNIFKIAKRLNNKIKFLGYIPKNEKIYIYNLASIFIFPSFYEGFGFPPLESMACGTPVITSNTSSLPEIVTNNAITINPYNKQDIITALNELYFDKNLNKFLIEKGIKQVNKFNWELTSIKYLKLLND